VYLELLATLAIAATHQSQLGQDFEIYASQEFGLVELADAHSRASALMPQKKNPYALAAIRTQAGQAAGDVASALALCTPGRRAPITSTCSTAPFRERSTRRSRSPG
jgi:argininosuccinate lyase